MPSVSPDGNWVAFVAQTFPFEDGWAWQVHVLEICDQHDVAVRRSRAGVLAELVA